MPLPCTLPSGDQPGAGPHLPRGQAAAQPQLVRGGGAHVRGLLPGPGRGPGAAAARGARQDADDQPAHALLCGGAAAGVDTGSTGCV